MEIISKIREAITETRFQDAQRMIEQQFILNDSSLRGDLVLLYLEVSEAQHSEPSTDLLLEGAEISLSVDLHLSQKFLNKILNRRHETQQRRLLLLQIQIEDRKGNIQELHNRISKFQIYLFENKVPARHELIDSLIKKYFKQDFHLGLQDLAVDLLLHDLKRAEVKVQSLICSCFETASPRGIKEKLTQINYVLETLRDKKYFVIYQNLCKLMCSGVKEKQDYKRLVEMVVYFEDFRFQAIVLHILDTQGITKAAAEYAESIRSNPDYDFVYLDKYFPSLKRFYFQKDEEKEPEKSIKLPFEAIQLEEKLEHAATAVVKLEEIQDEEALLISSLKFQEFSTRELLELSVSFLQSELYRASLHASSMAQDSSQDTETYLKACYLKATSLHKLGDYRAALDLTFIALEKISTKEDVLSFLYLQADLYHKLDNVPQSKVILTKILSIDSQYRLAKERLLRLDEI